MRLIQYYQPGQGKRVGVVTRSDVVTDITSDGNRGLLSRSIEPDDIVIDVTSDESPGVLELIELSYKEGISMGILLADIQERVSGATSHTPLPGQADEDKLKFATLDVPPNPEVPHLLSPLDSTRGVGMWCDLQT